MSDSDSGISECTVNSDDSQKSRQPPSPASPASKPLSPQATGTSSVPQSTPPAPSLSLNRVVSASPENLPFNRFLRDTPPPSPPSSPPSSSQQAQVQATSGPVGSPHLEGFAAGGLPCSPLSIGSLDSLDLSFAFSLAGDSADLYRKRKRGPSPAAATAADTNASATEGDPSSAGAKASAPGSTPARAVTWGDWRQVHATVNQKGPLPLPAAASSQRTAANAPAPADGGAALGNPAGHQRPQLQRQNKATAGPPRKKRVVKRGQPSGSDEGAFLASSVSSPTQVVAAAQGLLPTHVVTAVPKLIAARQRRAQRQLREKASAAQKINTRNARLRKQVQRQKLLLDISGTDEELRARIVDLRARIDALTAGRAEDKAATRVLAGYVSLLLSQHHIQLDPRIADALNGVYAHN